MLLNYCFHIAILKLCYLFFACNFKELIILSYSREFLLLLLLLILKNFLHTSHIFHSLLSPCFLTLPPLYPISTANPSPF